MASSRQLVAQALVVCVIDLATLIQLKCNIQLNLLLNQKLVMSEAFSPARNKSPTGYIRYSDKAEVSSRLSVELKEYI